MRGLEKVRLECLLMALGHNLRKMAAKSRRFFLSFFDTLPSLTGIRKPVFTSHACP
jgi:hypothetical protein